MLGNPNKNVGTLYILKIRTQDKEKKAIKPEFEVLKKNDEGKWATVAHETSVSGTLVSLKTDEGEWEGNTYPIVNITLQDNDESYLLDCRMNILTRNLYNALLALDSFEDIQISLYQKESKKDGKVYPQIAVWQNRQLVKGKYALDEIPPVEKVKVGKKDVTDTTKVDEFFITHLNELAVKVKAAPKPVVSKKVSNNDTAETPAQDVVDNGGEVENGDDIPF